MILLLGGEYNGRRVAHWLTRSTDSETITYGAFQVARFLRCTISEETPYYTRSRIKIWVLGPPISWLDELANEPKPGRV